MRSSASYRARMLSKDEARKIWPKLDAVYPTYEKYRARTKREIPLIELDPIAADSD